MRRMFVFFIAIVFVVTIFAAFRTDAIDIYTFKKDRVDQDLEGNRGYIAGKPADIPEKKRDLKRTLIGVDIELPASFAGKSSEEKAETQPKKEAKPAAEKKVEGKKVEVKKQVEEEYIK